MSSENDDRIAAAIAKRKAADEAEAERRRSVQDELRQRQNTYAQAAAKFREDFRNIEVFIELRNRGLEDVGIKLTGDGGKAAQGYNKLAYTVSVNRQPSGVTPSLIFSLNENGLHHHIENTPGRRSNASATIDVAEADSKYYDDALTEYIETILAR